MKTIIIKVGLIVLSFSSISCFKTDNHNLKRVILANSEIDQSTIFDSNDDKIADIERWYRGSGITFEKVDYDFDGYWDFQGERYPSGDFEIFIKYPPKKYSVKKHHTFYATKAYALDKEILVR